MVPIRYRSNNCPFSIIETPKRHFLTRNDVFRRTLRKNPFRGVGCSLIEEPPKNEEKTSHPKCTAKSCIWGTKTPEPIDTKFCMSSAVHDVITHANFCEDWLRGFGVAMGRILAFSIRERTIIGSVSELGVSYRIVSATVVSADYVHHCRFINC